MPQQAVGRVTPGLREASLIELVGGDPVVTAPLVSALVAAGFNTRAVQQPSGKADALILAHGLSASGVETHFAALASLSAVARQFETSGGTLIILQDTGGQFQPSDARAWGGGLAGLARTAAHEFQNGTVRLIDIDLTNLETVPTAARLAEELLSGGTAPCVGLGLQGRHVPQDVPFDLPPGQIDTLTPQDTILVTGGARGVTADCIIELARRTKARFALLGRSPITPWPATLAPTTDEKVLRGQLAKAAKATGQKVSPADLNHHARALLAGAEIRATLAAVEAVGALALYLPTDVSDRAALRRAIDETERTLGPVTGLVHGSGVLADKLIREKTPEQVARVFGPKVDGLAALLNELDLPALKAAVFFSSVAARYGNAGQADYAMANEILNRVAHWLKASNPEAAITSINWGPWDGGMVDDGLRAKFAAMGVALIGREAGANVFADAVLSGAACPVELVVGAEIAHG